jgi:hypothetical protein
LTGGPIHSARSPEELWFLTATLPVAPVCESAPEVPVALGRIVDVALSMDKDERWSSARAMQQALRQLLVHEGVHASTYLGRDVVAVEGQAIEPVSVTGTTFPQTMFQGRRRRWVPAAMIAAAIAAAVGVATKHGQVGAAAAPRAATPLPMASAAVLTSAAAVPEAPAPAASVFVSQPARETTPPASANAVAMVPAPRPSSSVRRPARPKAPPPRPASTTSVPDAPAATARDLFDEP